MNTVSWYEDPFETLGECPDCGGDVELRQVPHMTYFDCMKCGTGWHVELDYAYRLGRSASLSGQVRRAAAAEASEVNAVVPSEARWFANTAMS